MKLRPADQANFIQKLEKLEMGFTPHHTYINMCGHPALVHKHKHKRTTKNFRSITNTSEIKKTKRGQRISITIVSEIVKFDGFKSY